MIGFEEGKCRLCGEQSILNEGIYHTHGDEAAQAYLFGFADGKASASEPTEQQAQGRNMCDFCGHGEDAGTIYIRGNFDEPKIAHHWFCLVDDQSKKIFTLESQLHQAAKEIERLKGNK